MVTCPQVLLQVLIILTGNYNFFNLLTLVLTTALLDDKHLVAKCNSGCKKSPPCKCQSVPASHPPHCPPGCLPSRAAQVTPTPCCGSQLTHDRLALQRGPGLCWPCCPCCWS